MGLVHRRLQLGQRERPELGGPGSGAGDLDQVDAVFDLVTDLLHDLVGAVHQQAERRRHRSQPARQRVTDALLRGDLSAGGGHPRPGDQPGLDRITHRGRDALWSAWVAGRRHAGPQDPSCIHRRVDRPVPHRRVDRQLLFAARLAEADVHVRVDETGQHRQPAGVDRGNRVVLVREPPRPDRPRRCGRHRARRCRRRSPCDPCTAAPDLRRSAASSRASRRLHGVDASAGGSGGRGSAGAPRLPIGPAWLADRLRCFSPAEGRCIEFRRKAPPFAGRQKAPPLAGRSHGVSKGTSGKYGPPMRSPMARPTSSSV